MSSSNKRLKADTDAFNVQQTPDPMTFMYTETEPQPVAPQPQQPPQMSDRVFSMSSARAFPGL